MGCLKLGNKPKFTEYRIGRFELQAKLSSIGVATPADMWNNWYYYTDDVGWANVLYHLVFSSSLYKPDRFDCEKYGLKAMITCSEEYGLNALCLAIGDMPLGRHGFNIFFLGDGFMLFEPNRGFEWAGIMEIGDNGYYPREFYG